MQEQIRKFGALLNKVQVRHALGFVLELRHGDAQHLAQHVTRVVERQCLVEIAGKKKVFTMFVSHVPF